MKMHEKRRELNSHLSKLRLSMLRAASAARRGGEGARDAKDMLEVYERLRVLLQAQVDIADECIKVRAQRSHCAGEEA